MSPHRPLLVGCREEIEDMEQSTARVGAGVEQMQGRKLIVIRDLG